MLRNVISESFIYIIFGFIVKLFTKIFPFEPISFKIDNAKKSAVLSLKVITALIFISILYLTNLTKLYPIVHSLGIIIIQSLLYLIMTVIVILTALHNKESLKSLGITKINTSKSCILGLLLGTVFFLISQASSGFDRVTGILSVRSMISMITFLFVGFGEEIIFRGYFQTRMIAWLGKNKGILVTAIIFSFYHLTQNMVVEGYTLQGALINCFGLIPISLFYGYTMLKTKNIFSVSILHTLMNWTIH